MRWMKAIVVKTSAPRIWRCATTLIAGVLGAFVVSLPVSGVSITIPSATALPPSVLVEDVSVTITDNVAAATPGSLVTTIITVTNHWDEPRKLYLRYLRPQGLTAFNWSFVFSDGYSAKAGLAYDKLELRFQAHVAGGNVFVDGYVPTLQGGSSVVITLTSTVMAAETGTGTITSRVLISSPQFDERPANNEAIDTTLVGPPPTGKAPTTTGAASTTTGAASTTSAKPILTVAPTTVGAVAPASTVAVASPSTTFPANTRAPAPTPTASAVDGFQSPTGATKCQLVSNPVTGQAIRCAVAGSTAKLPRRPATCDFDWEDIAVNATGRAYTVCAGDSLDANYPVLANGQTWKRSVFTCTSAKSGITCRNPSKRGFRITKTKRTYL